MNGPFTAGRGGSGRMGVPWEPFLWGSLRSAAATRLNGPFADRRLRPRRGSLAADPPFRATTSRIRLNGPITKRPRLAGPTARSLPLPLHRSQTRPNGPFTKTPDLPSQPPTASPSASPPADPAKRPAHQDPRPAEPTAHTLPLPLHHPQTRLNGPFTQRSDPAPCALTSRPSAFTAERPVHDEADPGHANPMIKALLTQRRQKMDHPTNAPVTSQQDHSCREQHATGPPCFFSPFGGTTPSTPRRHPTLAIHHRPQHGRTAHSPESSPSPCHSCLLASIPASWASIPAAWHSIPAAQACPSR
jgi:hypothetical protein